MNEKPLVVFAHGKESGPWGSKISHLADIARELGANVLSPNYRDLDSPDGRAERLIALPLPPHSRLLLVGSSMGGYVSLLASRPLKPSGLFLMAPALYMHDYAQQSPAPGTDRVCIVHGWNDATISVEHSYRFAKEFRADLHLINSDHRLDDSLEYLGELFRIFSSPLLIMPEQ